MAKIDNETIEILLNQSSGSRAEGEGDALAVRKFSSHVEIILNDTQNKADAVISMSLDEYLLMCHRSLEIWDDDWVPYSLAEIIEEGTNKMSRVLGLEPLESDEDGDDGE